MRQSEVPAAPAAAAGAVADGLPSPRRFWAGLTIVLAMSVAMLDSTIANVALPTLSRELAVSPAQSLWIVNAYQLAVVITLLPAAVLADCFGYRRIYRAGLIIFVIGSTCCVLSHGLAQLTAARVVSGMGVGCLMSINTALVRFTYPRALLAKGMASNMMVMGLAAAGAPTVAGAVLAVASWQWLFAIHLPVAGLALIGAFTALPRMDGVSRRLDWVAIALNAMTFGLLILGADSLVRDSQLLGAAELVTGAVAGVLLVRHELQQQDPLLPLDLLRVPRFSLGLATAICALAGQIMGLIALPFWLQGELGRSAAESGFLITPWPVGMAVGSPIAARLAERVTPNVVCAAGMCVLACGLICLAVMPPTATDADVLWRVGLCGLGVGLFLSLNNKTVVDSAPMRRTGAAGGLLAMTRLLGQTIGSCVIAALFHVGGGQPAFTALLVAASVALVAALVSLARTRAPVLEDSALHAEGRGT